MTDEKIKDKIAALLAKAEKTDNMHEQDAFMRKVNELLEKHQIEMHEIRAHGVDKDPMTEIVGDMTRAAEWPSRVGWALAAYYGCKMLRWKQNTIARYTWRAYGRESAVTTFELMFPFVQSQVRMQARNFARIEGVTLAKAERSVGMALAARIWRLSEGTKAARDDMVGKGLIPVSDVEAFMLSLAGKPKEVKALTAPIEAGAGKYAEKVSLNLQTTAKEVRQIKGA